MTTHLGLQRILLPSAQVSQLTTGSITLPSARGAFVSPSSFESIATVLVSSTTSSITFSSIPATFKHLQIRGIVRTTRASSAGGDFIAYRYNGDSTNGNYIVGHQLYAQSTGTIGSFYNGVGDGCIVERVPSADQTSNTFAPMLIDIIDYSDTNKYKISRAHTGYSLSSGGGTAQVHMASNLWKVTSAISSIVIVPGAGPGFATNTRLSLYGIKG